MSQFYTQVKNPKWANTEHSAIDCQVNFSHLNEEFVPFTANPTDSMEYSKTIFDECIANQYGEISEYVAQPVVEPTSPTKEELMAQIQELAAKVEALGS